MKPPVRNIDVEVFPPMGNTGSSHATRTGTGGAADDPFVALIAKLMDTVFTIPGTNIRFGLDPILGLIPGLGDTASGLVSAVLILKSARHGVPKVVLVRMAMNALANTTLGSIPILGDLFSFWFKSNAMNYDLLLKHGGEKKQATSGDWLFVSCLLAAILVVVILVIVGGATLVSKLLGGL